MKEQETITATEAYSRFRVTRKWLRDQYALGNVRRFQTTGTNPTGERYVKYLYPVRDIVIELARFRSNSQHRKMTDGQRARLWDQFFG